MANVNLPTDGKLPSNSRTKRPGGQNHEVDMKESPVEVLTQGKRKKKSLGAKMESTFLDGATEYLGSTLFYEIIAPTVKDLISELVSTGINMILYKDGTPPRGRGRGYGGGYNRPVAHTDSRMTMYNTRNPRARQGSPAEQLRSFDDIGFGTRGEADEVFDALLERLEIYDRVDVYTLYTMCGITPKYTDKNWGWTNLSDARVRKDVDGYVLQLPRAEAL